ncbi:carboxypeptidase-like regulatory domain-containing protein [Longimicrobium terrae]|uniref:Carboxypeptidase regulatory-like domain-containing protein n=1 Tax=Longimicrobium terrae TaxID=1639882 RepID=A0A841GMV8_9BACT|nr:carboxypeptidase-like regulatory domain-containing protein [Longimicrobium terrae]MBB4635737.1 hypothetical protein [Longimicrobium terrae]MBB6070131.1 hypothetical protein [Longimicrobium terrae]NNC33032.1 carboxypeptidase regulatory-like domain-containing protein [Longimicrobium terrae]
MRTKLALRPLLGAALLAAAIAPHAAAQTIHAAVVRGSSGEPLPEVLVRAQSEDGRTVGAGFTRLNGVAVLRLREAGTFRLVAQRGGYNDASVGTVRVGEDGDVTVPVRMTARPFSMDTVTVIAQLRSERGRQAFNRRRVMGEGVYLDNDYLLQRNPREVTDFLIGVPGIAMRPGREGAVPVSMRGTRCMVTLVDGRPVPALMQPVERDVVRQSMNRLTANPRGHVISDPAGRSLNRMVFPDDVVAIEVYREWSEVPLEYRQYAFTPQTPERCGAYLYWTGARW